MTLSVALTDDLGSCFVLRHEVFVREQAVPEELERDEHDATCDHAVALRGGVVVGTGRLVAPGSGPGSIGRMAVSDEARGAGVGAALLRRLEERAAERGLPAVELHAQLHARRFYERAGYEAFGEPYLEAGIEHVSMRKRLG